ncbi:acetyl-CoA acetyltransferase [Mycolicibacterium palauense]|uniref:acetyl-CoA acetyltransferase n=1 Tax=Mycolicibacterium palauense TaxID=2034511 RepID=UPI000BFEEF2D|nr:acetyl-CoA acetyltransferase [Mycolicibacterium palauense]
MDNRTPVIVGTGQVNQRSAPDEALDPVGLMELAARAAAPAHLLESVQTVHVVNLLSWRYRDPGRLLAELLGARPNRTTYSGVGGNVPQSLVNQACLDIQSGRVDVVLVAGGEAWRTRMKLRAEGRRPDWPRQDDAVAPAERGADVPFVGEADERIGLDRPAYVYPLFEQALRIANREGMDAHRRRIGELWSRFSFVAQHNPHAWSRQKLSAEQIWRPRPDNRMVAWPYTKLMNSNNMVDQAAVVILASAEMARRLRIPSDRWVFPYAGSDAHDTCAVGERAQLHRSPAIRVAGARVQELSGLHADEIDLIDIYSCFPSAVQVAADELGLSLDDPGRPVTVTGGLTFAGGPWNNYVTHSIATVADRLRNGAGRRALVTANGGYLTKHSFGVYGTEPPRGEFRWEDVQAEVDRESVRVLHTTWQGAGHVESWTAQFDREGRPQRLFVAVCTPDGGRTLATLDDLAVVADAVHRDLAGVPVRVNPDGTAVFD